MEKSFPSKKKYISIQTFFSQTTPKISKDIEKTLFKQIFIEHFFGRTFHVQYFIRKIKMTGNSIK
jgi:hypothetical protein